MNPSLSKSAASLFAGVNRWGLASIFAGLPVYLLLLLFLWSISDFSGNVGGDGMCFLMLFALPVLSFLSLLGFVLGLIGIVQTRGRRSLPWMGLFFNCPLLAVFASLAALFLKLSHELY
jgi:hypothetical protein